jgi:hypothetical protein
MRLSSIGQNPCGPLAGNRDRDRRPCEGFSEVSAARPVASARTASRLSRDAVVRLVVFVAQPQLAVRFFPLHVGSRSCSSRETRTAKSGCATNCAIPRRHSTAHPNAYAMISLKLGRRAEFPFVFHLARRSTPMMASERFTRSRRAVLFLFFLLGIPSVARAASLGDSAKELARKIAAALPARDNVSCEFRNVSSLRPGETARIEQAFKAELQERGVRLTASGAPVAVLVTLSENFKNLIWTGEIRRGDVSHVVLLAVERSPENRAFPSAMPVTIRSEKFWEGPERILDAGEISDGAAKSWLVLLLPDGLRIQNQLTGSATTIEIASNQSTNRDPWGNLDFEPSGNTTRFFLSPRVCTVNLETAGLDVCSSTEGSTGPPVPNGFPVMFDIAPAGPPPPGKGTVIEISSVCGGASQFLATGARDYTQTDSLQVFKKDTSGAVAISAELDFPGPITALHALSGMPRAVVRNLITGNYEAYRLSISCGP